MAGLVNNVVFMKLPAAVLYQKVNETAWFFRKKSYFYEFSKFLLELLKIILTLRHELLVTLIFKTPLYFSSKSLSSLKAVLALKWTFRAVFFHSHYSYKYSITRKITAK